MTDKIEQLLQFHKETPDDPFLIYALANAHQKYKKYPKAVEFYELLLNNHPNYGGTYLHYAKLQTEMNNYHKADEVYQKGIDVLRKLGDTKNLNELLEAYEIFKQIAQ